MEKIRTISKKELRRVPQIEILRKLLGFERGLLGLIGAWMCRLRRTEIKYMAAHHLWEWAQHVDLIRRRLLELPGGKPDAALDPKMEAILHECLFAEDELPFLEVLYQVILPELRDGYMRYKERSDELPDRPSIYIVEGIIKNLNEQIKRGSETLNNGDIHNSWATHISQLFFRSGEIFGPAAETEINSICRYSDHVYSFPAQQHRESGAHFTYHFPPVDGLNLSDGLLGSDVDLARIVLAVWLYNEMDAAEYIPSILYEIKGMPWEFYYDVARHTWDEARHSEFGYHLLLRLGFTPSEFEVSVSTYMSTIALKPHERYAAVTCWYEPGSFQVKPDYMEKLAKEIGEEDWAIELLRFDLADETTHVAFGHKWVEKLMIHYGDQRTLDEFVTDVIKKGMELREVQAQNYERTMPAEIRLNMDKLRKRTDMWRKDRGSNLI